MPILRVECPECAAGLSSKAGFIAGQRIKCPKCETAFAVPGAKPKKPVLLEEDEDDRPVPKKKPLKPAVVEDDDDEEEERPKKRKKAVSVDDDEDEDERPKKKKKKGKQSKDDADEGGGYANSPLRYVILGVLVVVMLVMGYFLYLKFTAPPVEIIVPNRLDKD